MCQVDQSCHSFSHVIAAARVLAALRARAEARKLTEAVSGSCEILASYQSSIYRAIEEAR